MFNSITTNKKIRKATLEELDLPSQIKLYYIEYTKMGTSLKDEWRATYSDYQMSGTFITEYIIDKPVFTNLQWVLTTTDYPDGELAALLYLGTLRSEKKTIKLYGDYNNQSIDITQLVKKEIYSAMREKYESQYTLYNIDSGIPSFINYVCGMMKYSK